MEYIARLAAAADIPGFSWKNLVLGFTVGQYAFTTYLSYRQYRVLGRKEPPKELAQVMDEPTYKRTQQYHQAKSLFGFVSGFVGFAQNVAVIHFDVLPKLFSLAGKALTYAPSWFPVGLGAQSIVMFLGFQLAGSIINLPLSWYQNFVLEEKFGFNKQTLGLFFSDFFKTQALSIVIGAPVMVGMLKIVDYFGDKFFFYIWLFLLAFQVVMIAVFPTLIQPLFNKLTPMEDGELKTSVENLAKRVSFPLTKLYVIDGSRRSSHSNAYFYGLPWSKQIVIFDTLIKQSSVAEVTAVLAHEIGHWSLSHTSKMLLVGQAHLLAIFTMFSAFIKNNSLYQSFGFHNQQPMLVGLLLFLDILQPLDSVMTFAMNLLSRTYEFEADAYAKTLGYTEHLGQALVTIHKENLGAVDADWLYSSYHHSHPILPERLRAMGWKPKEE